MASISCGRPILPSTAPSRAAPGMNHSKLTRVLGSQMGRGTRTAHLGCWRSLCFCPFWGSVFVLVFSSSFLAHSLLTSEAVLFSVRLHSEQNCFKMTAWMQAFFSVTDFLSEANKNAWPLKRTKAKRRLMWLSLIMYGSMLFPLRLAVTTAWVGRYQSPHLTFQACSSALTRVNTSLTPLEDISIAVTGQTEPSSPHPNYCISTSH